MRRDKSRLYKTASGNGGCLLFASAISKTLSLYKRNAGQRIFQDINLSQISHKCCKRTTPWAVRLLFPFLAHSHARPARSCTLRETRAISDARNALPEQRDHCCG